MVGYELIGVDKVIANLNRMSLNIKTDATQGLRNAADALRDDAIQNLENSINPEWGHGIDTSQSITNKNLWIKTLNSWKSINLVCNSNHAAVVEAGGFHGQGGKGTVTALVQGGPYAIGASQGKFIGYRGSFRIQQGYSYLRGALGNPNTMDKMIKEVGGIINKALARSSV